MASIKVPTPIAPLVIERFLGLNSNEISQTQILLGEASEMKNLRITDSNKLETIEGYKEILNTEEEVKAMFPCTIDGEQMLLYQVENDLYKLYKDLSSTNIYNNIKITNDSLKMDDTVSFCMFNDKVYILDGKEYYSYDRTEIKVVEGYAPLVAIGTPATGGGTDYEGVNLLSAKRHQTFSPDGTAKEFQLREKDIASVDKVEVGGTETSEYTVNLKDGKVTFNSAPSEGADTVDIYWSIKTEEQEKNRKNVTRNRYFTTYGSGNDTRVFIWGDEEAKNRIRYSDLAKGLTSAEYFPATNFKDEGTSNFGITGVAKQYDRLVIFKENSTRFAQYNTYVLPNGTSIVALESYPLNDTTGNIPINQVGMLDNFPVSISKKGIYEFIQTNVRSETNVEYIGNKVQNILDRWNLNNIKTYDYEQKHEWWMIHDNEILIYNYDLKLFYKFELPHAPKSIAVFDKELYFGYANGIMKFDETEQTFNGETIEQLWESGYMNFGKEVYKKSVNKIFVSCQPYLNSNIDFEFETDRGTSNTKFHVDILMANFEDVNFNRFSFDTIYNPKPRRGKVKVKKFVYLKVRIINNEWKTKFKILSIAMKHVVGGETK